MHNQRIIVRYDGIYPEYDGDNLAFTVLDHFIGADGRDYFKTSWIGALGLLRIGLNLDQVEVVGPDSVVSDTRRK